MPIIAPKPTDGGGDFARVKPGTYAAVCQSVHDLGILETTYQGETKKQHKIIILWELDERIPDGKFQGERFIVSKRYTLSLHEKSTLRGDLKSWRGRDFTEDELAAFDLEKLRGANCLISMVEIEKSGKVYTNVAAIMGAPKGSAKLTPELPADHVFEWIERIKGTSVSSVPENNEPLPF
jgi:hypothetical protein